MAQEILSDLGWKIFEVVLPILATSLTSLVLVLVGKAWNEFIASRPDIADEIKWAAEWVVPVVEQLKKNGSIPDNKQAKEYAIYAVEQFLESKNLNISPEKYRFVIAASIEGAVQSFNEWQSIASAEIAE